MRGKDSATPSPAGAKRLFPLPPVLGGPPAFLTPVAKAEWDAVIQQLGATGFLHEADRTFLAAYCMSVSMWRLAEDLLIRDGLLVQEPILNSRGELRGHRTVRHPAVSVANEAKRTMLAYARLFGLDPGQRIGPAQLTHA